MTLLNKFFSKNNTNTQLNYRTAPQSKETIEALWKAQKIILNNLDFNDVAKKIVDGLLVELGYLRLGYRIIVLTLVNEEEKVLKRVSLSHTLEASLALAASAVPFKDIDIPLSTTNNLLIRSIIEQKEYVTHNWPEIFTPALTAEQALQNQKAAGIKTSMIFPIIVQDKAIGAMIFSMIKDESEVSENELDLIRGFTDIVGIAVQNAGLYSSLQHAKEDIEAKNNQLQEANTKLQELDKLKDEFLSIASHELRTPMTAVRSYLWMALDGKTGDLNEKQKLYLDRAYKSTNHLIALVNDLLNISRIESGRLTLDLQAVKLDILAQEVLDEVTPRAQELGVHLKLNNVSDLPDVLADADKIKEVIFNLVGNSLKFTPKDGEISISFAQKGAMVEIQIKDTGSGILPEDLSKLFQKFGYIQSNYLPDRPAQGTGLGLYICKKIVELHKGTISVTSDGRGKGATFTFTLKVLDNGDLEMLSHKPKDEQKPSIGLEHQILS